MNEIEKDLEFAFANYQDQPREITLETLAICNASCTFCPYPTIERKGTRMSDELIDKVLAEMETFRKPFWFSPFKLSDPLLEKRLFNIIRHINIHIPLCSIRIFTNGSALTAKKASELNKAGNIDIYISLNETNKEKYEKTMGIPYHRTIKNIDNLHASGFRHPVYIQRVGKQPDFHEFCEHRWPNFSSLTLNKESWLGFTEAEHNIPNDRCMRWLELSIMATGKVALCCMDAEGKYAIGDINKESMLEIYQRWTHRKKESRKGIVPCQTCTYG